LLLAGAARSLANEPEEDTRADDIKLLLHRAKSTERLSSTAANARVPSDHIASLGR
jgi:hypothetical protein